MRAAFYETTGPATNVLRVGALEDPQPGPDEVVIAIEASGINPTDVKTRGGVPGRKMGHDRVVPHHDGAGTIVACGANVSNDRLGQRVWLHSAQFGRASGTAAERIAVPSRLASTLPDNVSMEEGACLGVPVMTAYQAVLGDGAIKGKRVLVTGGAGAVGHYAIQIARLSGARVAATVSSPEKAEQARNAGAEIAVDYRSDDAAQTLRDWSDGRGIDLAIDLDTSSNAFFLTDILAMGGRIVSYGSKQNEAMMPIRDLRQKLATVRFLFVFQLPQDVTDTIVAAVNDLVAAERLSHRIAGRFPLDQIAQAHELVEAGSAMGKVLVLPTL